MGKCYVLKIDEKKKLQDDSDLSFIGGFPKLSPDMKIPKCTLCGKEETFMFQVAFPNEHIWKGLTMAIFACTSCAKEGHFIPEMLKGKLKGANIPREFLKEYQCNFKILTFKTATGIVKTDYCQKVKFKKLRVEKIVDSKRKVNKIGGVPNWILEDESPSVYDSNIPMFFLLQILEGFKFEKLEEAPPQIELGLTGSLEPSENEYYELFIGNAIYLFGTMDINDPQIYIITQI